MSETHETAVLTEGQLAEFVGAGTKALILIANKLGLETTRKWANKGEAMERAFIQALAPEAKTEPTTEPAKPEPTTRPAPETMTFSVNYDEKVEKLVKVGKYGWSNDNITSKNFPITQTGTVEKEAILVHFDRNTESDDVVKELVKMGLRPADAHETLAFGTQFLEGLGAFPFPVAGLGAVVLLGGYRRVVCLDRCGDGRVAYLVFWDGRWSADCRFLAFRK